MVSESNSSDSTAVVLGGGGIVGIAWHTGLLYGLEQAGIRLLADADIVVGTSAGSVVAAHVTASSTPLAERYQRQIEIPETDEVPGATRPPAGLSPINDILESGTSVEDGLRKLGAFAVERGVLPEQAGGEGGPKQRAWPTATDLRITTVDCDSGERVVFTRESGAPLAAAVQASSTIPGVWPVVTINGRRYMDGGFWSGSNVDVAADAARLIVISPFAQGRRPGTSPREQLEALPGTGILITPDDAARAAFGQDSMSLAVRQAAAKAGLAQAPSEVERIRALLSA